MIITEFGMLSNLSYWKTSLKVGLGVSKHKVRGRDGSLDRIDAIFGMMKAKLFSLRVDAGTKRLFFEPLSLSSSNRGKISIQIELSSRRGEIQSRISALVSSSMSFILSPISNLLPVNLFQTTSPSNEVLIFFSGT
jgi:hypothetical protein